jgi:hypothetical protein
MGKGTDGSDASIISSDMETMMVRFKSMSDEVGACPCQLFIFACAVVWQSQADSAGMRNWLTLPQVEWPDMSWMC